jgi:hypothetical protein
VSKFEFCRRAISSIHGDKATQRGEKKEADPSHLTRCVPAEIMVRDDNEKQKNKAANGAARTTEKYRSPQRQPRRIRPVGKLFPTGFNGPLSLLSLRGAFVEGVNHGSGRMRNRNRAVQANFLGGEFLLVNPLVRVIVRTQRRALKRDARK